MSAINTLGGALASLGFSLPAIRESARSRPTLKNAKRANRKLDAAFDQHVDDIKPGASVGYHLNHNTPQGETFIDRVGEVFAKPTAYAGSSAPGRDPLININPNADRALFAHELGHLASQQTDVGHLAASLRHTPKLKNAMLGAMVTLPGLAAVMEDGDDDYDSSMALAALTAAPTLIDEGLATTNGLAIMNKAGLRADLGQRGKLAGGLLSYLAPAIIAGTAGNAVGNMLDRDQGEL